MYEYKATVAKVVDGDTIDVLIDLGFSTYTKQRLRFARIDAPSIKTPEGKVAKAFVANALPIGSEIVINTKDQDKYGRYLAEVVTKEGNLNDLMLQKHEAQGYDPKNKLG